MKEYIEELQYLLDLVSEGDGDQSEMEEILKERSCCMARASKDITNLVHSGLVPYRIAELGQKIMLCMIDEGE